MFEAEYYQILGVKSNATDTEIKQAFKKKAMELHPDKNRNDPKATEKFQQINEAYETLKDPIKKKEYDLKHQPKKQSTNNCNGSNTFKTYEDILRDLFGFRTRFTFNQSRTRTSNNSYRNFFVDDSDDDTDDDDDSDDESSSEDFCDDDKDTIFIGGLPTFTSESDLRDAFSSYHPYRVKVVNKSFSQPPFGFVQFLSSSEMRKAVRERPNVLINGKICRAKVSHTNLYDHSSRRRRFYF